MLAVRFYCEPNLSTDKKIVGLPNTNKIDNTSAHPPEETMALLQPL